MSLGVWAGLAEVEKCTRWAREFWEAMQPWSTGGAYVNHLGNEGAGESRLPMAQRSVRDLSPLRANTIQRISFGSTKTSSPPQATSAAMSA